MPSHGLRRRCAHGSLRGTRSGAERGREPFSASHGFLQKGLWPSQWCCQRGTTWDEKRQLWGLWWKPPWSQQYPTCRLVLQRHKELSEYGFGSNRRQSYVSVHRLKHSWIHGWEKEGGRENLVCPKCKMENKLCNMVRKNSQGIWGWRKGNRKSDS